KTNTRRYDEPAAHTQQLAIKDPIEPKNNSTVQTGNTVEIIDRALDAAEIAAAQNNASSKNTTGLNVSAVGSSQPLVQTVAYVPSQEVENENVYIANTSVDKKNKLRGLFRKVTRVIERTTNLPAVEEKGILIGSFEIALK
ncbi:MAG TPA: hypothetical protein VEB42_15870, partial [Chitinophagaceae bacterium]|nr:hypothetical protein [Chitinophagaceae bacterium]